MKSEITKKKPTPDFDEFIKVLSGEKTSSKVRNFEVHIDPEIMKYVMENYFGENWFSLDQDNKIAYQKQLIDFHYKMGYDCVPIMPGWHYNFPALSFRVAENTAELAAGNRGWTEEAVGLISSMEDYHKIDWANVELDPSLIELTGKYLPDGMKYMVTISTFQIVLDVLFGATNLFVLSHDDPELVQLVSDTWGQKVFEFYEKVMPLPEVGAVMHSDDLGGNNGLLLKPEFYRKTLFPWLKKYVDLAHDQGKPFFLHCCGDATEIVDELIDDVGIDGYHSFQDNVVPVEEFFKKYGSRTAVMGGVDVDNLARMETDEIRAYTRKILSECTPGRYVLGSGNSITNYIKPENYVAMLEEGYNWNNQ